MKRFLFILKRIVQLLLIIAVIVGFVFTVGAAVNKNKTFVCSAIQVNVEYPPFMQLVNEKDIEDKITYLSGRSIVGKPLSAIDFNTLEKELERIPYVKNAEIYTTQNHNVYVDIVQRKPILRVINNDGVSYYLSEEQTKMPLPNTFTTNVPLAIGYVETHEDLEGDSIVLKQLFDLVNYVQKDTMLSALIDQIYVTETGSFELIPKFNYHTILFGKVDDKMDERFQNLKTFYKNVLIHKGWTDYKTINIQLPNQIIGVKRDTV